MVLAGVSHNSSAILTVRLLVDIVIAVANSHSIILSLSHLAYLTT